MRERFGPRATAIAVALAIEALLLLALLTLGQGGFAPAGEDVAMTTFDIGPAPDQEAERDAAAQEDAGDAPSPQSQPTPDRPVEEREQPAPNPPARPPVPVARPSPSPAQAPIIEMSPGDLAEADISSPPPRQPAAPAGTSSAYGPAAPSSAGDSQVVGSAPNGEPLYAARWYREPTDGELRGYLSTASGPGWALIACRTAPQWRVEDCVGLDESPAGSNLQRAVLAAAWQFQVRPPRKGNQSLMGAWVRIRIDYRRP